MDVLLCFILVTILGSTVSIYTEEQVEPRRNELRRIMKSDYDEIAQDGRLNQLNSESHNSAEIQSKREESPSNLNWRLSRRTPRPGIRSSKTYFGRLKETPRPIREFKELYALTNHPKPLVPSDDLSLPFLPVKNNYFAPKEHPVVSKSNYDHGVKVIPGHTKVEIIRGVKGSPIIVNSRRVGHSIVVGPDINLEYSNSEDNKNFDSTSNITKIVSNDIYPKKINVEDLNTTDSDMKYLEDSGPRNLSNYREKGTPVFLSGMSRESFFDRSLPSLSPFDSNTATDTRNILDIPEGSGEELLVPINPNPTENANINNKGFAAFASIEQAKDQNLRNNLRTSIKQNKSRTDGRFLKLFSGVNETVTCKTPKDEPGHCRNFRDCVLHEVLNNFSLYLQYMCIIRSTFVGICCPDNPVVEVVNPDENSASSDNETEVSSQPANGCGINTKTRIVGGTISKPHEWTWMVALLRRNRFFCGGVLINNWHVLTAAHCVSGVKIKDITVRLGEYNFNDRTKHKQDIRLSEIKRHAKFITLTFQHDIALLKLRHPVKFSRFVGTICLPNAEDGFADVNATVVGWGTISFGGAASPVLRQVTIPVWSNSDCDKTYSLENINDSFMCAGSPDDEQDACQGDSGGPLMSLNDQGRWQVIGLVSWGRRCGDPNFPGVYTRVTTYLDWIQENMQ